MAEQDRGAFVGRAVVWLLLANATAAILTNAYHLRWAEPAVSRNGLGLVSVALAAAAFLVQRSGRSPGQLVRAAAARRHLWAAPGLLVLILALAFALRLWGISAGLPQSYPADEYDYVHHALKMMKRGDLNPHSWYYPTLQRYLTLIAYMLVFLAGVARGRWQALHQIVEEDLLYWGRFVGVLAGTATVLVTYYLARRLLGRRAALLAAALVAVFPATVEHSQYNKPDPLLILMVPLSVLVTLVYLEHGRRGQALGCGLVMGLTIASKYNGGLVVLPFLLAVGLRRGRRLLAAPDLYLAAGGTLLGFLAACPYVLSELDLFLNHVANDIHTYAIAGLEGAEGVHNWAQHARYAVEFGAGPAASGAGLVGLGIALQRLDGRLAVFLAFPVLYYGYYSSQRINHAGNMIVVFPFLAVLAALAAKEGAAWLARQRFAARHSALQPWALAALGALLAWTPLWTSVKFNSDATRKDTGSYAREWIDEHFPAGTHFAVERHCPVLDRERYTVTTQARIVNRSLEEYRQAGVEYLIVTSYRYARFSEEHPQTRKYQRLFARTALVKEFRRLDDFQPGPQIRILALPPAR